MDLNTGSQATKFMMPMLQLVHLVFVFGSDECFRLFRNVTLSASSSIEARYLVISSEMCGLYSYDVSFHSDCYSPPVYLRIDKAYVS